MTLVLQSPATSLRDLRERSGLTLSQVVEAASEHDERFPRSHAGVLEIEQRGTRDYWKIHALAAVYGVSPDLVARLAKPWKSA